MVKELLKTALGRLRIVAFMEGCSFLHRWSIFKIFMAFLASLIPFGTFYADKVLFRKVDK
jgi:hypothetical protein